ncbi:MAG: RHS repeat-associated core domain-containing protein [Opitutaceae bacterium]|nr:RHS repeat-associated core domain-containing protein [Opitutaceae bacterium]
MPQEGAAYADYGDATYRQYADNGRGELTAGVGYLGTNVTSKAAPLPGRRHEYACDSIGNRQWSDSTGVSGLRDDYTANALNQYVARENNTLSLSGTATTDSVVAVKGRTVTAGRQGRFWSDEVTVPNVLGPWAGPLSVYATKSAAGSNVMRIDSRAAQLPAVSQSFSRDLDGNTLSDEIWDYQWDAENRLVRLETTVAARSAGFAHRILNFTYDYLGRRVQKQVMDGVTSTELSSQRFIYNGWDVIAEYSVSAGTTLDKLQRTYAWGIDLASSLTKAGGVGALLQFANTPTGQTYLPTYDGNGNVASLVNLGTGALAASYEYTPFGEMLRYEVLDNAVSTYAFKFSTRWRDAETGWSYYGRRYYDARMGRFVGRDPIGEEGGINLYEVKPKGSVRTSCIDRTIRSWEQGRWQEN